MLVISYGEVSTRLGNIWLGSTSKGLFCLNIGAVDAEGLQGFFAGGRQVAFRQGGDLVERAGRELAQYLDRKQKRFSVPLDLSGWSPFARRVWRVTTRIPYGQVRTYAWVADRVGGPNFARAVGGALGANPIPIVVPCHRVVGAHGSLGGFTGGVGVKRWLLDFEAGSQTLPL
ncbi:MAG: methylated-DNA--[protein]-cysteine S-methyltransferase [Candidatus Eisenbacteria bacterium]